MQPLKVRAPLADIYDTHKSMAEISNIEASTERYQHDVSTLRVCHGVDFAPVLVVRKEIVNPG